IYLCFFFSSRRRHTRSKRDWSSDVCSSDLLPKAETIGITSVAGRADIGEPRGCRWPGITPQKCAVRHRVAGRHGRQHVNAKELRSEERRVGKECRSRWWADQ